MLVFLFVIQCFEHSLQAHVTSGTNPPMHQSHIPQCTNLQQKCAHVCTFLLQNVASWDTVLCILGFVRWTYNVMCLLVSLSLLTSYAKQYASTVSMFVHHCSSVALFPFHNKYFSTTLYVSYSFALLLTYNSHDDVIKWKHFPRYWPFVRGIHRWISRT